MCLRASAARCRGRRLHAANAAEAAASKCASAAQERARAHARTQRCRGACTHARKRCLGACSRLACANWAPIVSKLRGSIQHQRVWRARRSNNHPSAPCFQQVLRWKQLCGNIWAATRTCASACLAPPSARASAAKMHAWTTYAASLANTPGQDRTGDLQRVRLTS